MNECAVKCSAHIWLTKLIYIPSIFTYDARGRLQMTTYANSARQDYAYNSDNRLDRLTMRGAAGYLINDYIYHYTPGGMLDSISAYQNSSSYSYDALNQIASDVTTVGAGQAGAIDACRAYAYDANGNRTTEQRTDVLPNVGATSVSRSYNGGNGATADDRITSYAQTSATPSLQYSAIFSYDARGNRLAQSSSLPSTHPSLSFGYDAFSRMTGATNGSASVVYTYDALGRKVKRDKQVNESYHFEAQIYYIYDGLDPVCAVDANPAPNQAMTVTWLLRGLGVAPGIGNIVAQQRYTTSSSGVPGAPEMYYHHPNHRGDTAYLTDASGVKAASYVYDAFGRMLTDSPSALTVYRFSGKEWDADAQLYYFGFRWYDPDTGTDKVPGGKFHIA